MLIAFLLRFEPLVPPQKFKGRRAKGESFSLLLWLFLYFLRRCQTLSRDTIHVRPHFHTYPTDVLRPSPIPDPFLARFPSSFSLRHLPFRSTAGTFFNLRLPQWVIKWQRAKWPALPHPADRRMPLLESIQFLLWAEPVSNRFLLFCIHFLCHCHCPVLVLDFFCPPFSLRHVGIVAPSRWPPDVGWLRGGSR